MQLTVECNAALDGAEENWVDGGVVPSQQLVHNAEPGKATLRQHGAHDAKRRQPHIL